MSTNNDAKAELSSLPSSVEIFDTTLRDGAQFEGISLTVEDKLRVAEQLDWLGVHWIEGGYPQANPKDEEFFKRLQQHLYHKPEVLKARLPRPHQNQAIADAVTYFVKKKHKRGKLIMPCGTGKSLTSYFIAQKVEYG